MKIDVLDWLDRLSLLFFVGIIVGLGFLIYDVTLRDAERACSDATDVYVAAVICATSPSCKLTMGDVQKVQRAEKVLKDCPT